MLSPTLATLRLFLHVTAATIWVGGQFALAGVVPALRKVAPHATKPVAQAFARLAWPAFGVLVVTGMWNVMAIDIVDTSSAYQATVMAHIALAAGAGVFVAVHQFGASVAAKAIGGSLGALLSIGALFVGLLLRTGTA
jgi:putative copper export protein